MSGEKDLKILLKMMSPVVNEGTYVFCTTTELVQVNMEDLIMSFKEAEGYTMILAKTRADEAGLQYTFVASWITLKVHSSLEAVGLMAAVSRALAEVGISCNVVAGYFHDHLFVDVRHTEKAMDALRKLSSQGV